ncbi:MAG: AMIN domain-containing protein, partial [Cyanobacteria bacterium]|nr:AMIN domain-containing protein [Cyanobacteriota bacterium]
MNPHLVTPTKSRFEVRLRWGVSFTGAIATCLWLGTPAQGNTLDDWQFDPHTQELTVVLPDGVTPNYFLLAEPARIVLNLPNTQLGSVQPAQYYSGPIQSIRVSQFDAESARVVVEFSPNTILDPRHAELSSQDLAGGTEWTLHPLVVDSPAG